MQNVKCTVSDLNPLCLGRSSCSESHMFSQSRGNHSHFWHTCSQLNVMNWKDSPWNLDFKFLATFYIYNNRETQASKVD